MLFSEFAKKLGYDVSVEDLAAEKAAKHEVNEEEVKAVTGGSTECGNISSYTDSQMTPVNCEILSICSSVAIEMGID